MKFRLRELIFVAMLLAVPIGLYTYVLKPRKADKEAMVAETRNKSEQLQKMKLVRLPAEQKTRENIKFLQKALETIQTRQPVAEAPDKFRSAIRQIALQNNLIITKFTERAISPGEPRERQYDVRGVMMSADGTYPNFYAFLLAVENGPRVIRVNRITMDAIREKGRNDSVAATLYMSVLSPKTKDQKK